MFSQSSGKPLTPAEVVLVATRATTCRRRAGSTQLGAVARRSNLLLGRRRLAKLTKPATTTTTTTTTTTATTMTGATLIALAAACLLVSLPSTHQQALASAQPDSNSQQALNYLMYSSSVSLSSSSPRGATPAPPEAEAPSSTTKTNSTQTPEAALKSLLKDVKHDHTSDRIDIELATNIWKQMHKNALEFAQTKTAQARPVVERFLKQSGVSKQCHDALGSMLDHVGTLDEWAMRMYNSFGELPTTGFFEGTMTSMGSYHQCINVAPNQWIERPAYCSFKFQPIIPKRPRFHNILSTIDERLANFTNKDDMFRGFATKVQYFYYTKMLLATCMPSKCARSDLDLIGEQIALNTYLQYQGVDCLEKPKGFNPDSAQVFALVILFALASVSLVGTLVHMLNVRSWLEPMRPRNCSSPLSSMPIELATSAHLKANQSHHHHPHHHQQDKQPVVLTMDTDLENNNNNNNNNTIGQHQVSRKQQQVPLNYISTASNISSSSSSFRRRPLVRLVDVLMHFSVIKNGRKLFDTSTSAGRGNSRAGSLVPGMREAVDSSAQNVPDGGRRNGNRMNDSHRSNSSSLEVQSNDISCVHGLRFWTISWIIMGHTMQYTEWAGFARTYQVEDNITSFLLHPLLNATFSVDTFFLISGLLTTYVTWTITRGHYWRFNKFAFLISRYLRLMPQVLIVILIFIVFPMLGDGPWWQGVIQKESDRCKQNWWVSALFLQSFYRSDQICNLVTWWLSIEMFYHFISIIVIIALLHSARKGILAALLVGGGMTGYSFYLHYANSYPPNMMPTLLQRFEIWDEIVLKYFWTPYPHAPSYFTGLLLGYALYNRSIGQLTRRQVRLGWTAFVVCYTTILFGTYSWNKNAAYSREAATLYYNLAQIFWSLATGWAILACALGEGGWLNDFLSSPVFIPLGRATYMTYLSHMLIVMSYPAKMNQLIEPSYIVFLYIFISNLVLSYALGICLTLVYESPILHLQKLLVARMASKFNEDPRMKRQTLKTANTTTMSGDEQRAARVALYTQAQQAAPANQQAAGQHHLLSQQAAANAPA